VSLPAEKSVSRRPAQIEKRRVIHECADRQNIKNGGNKMKKALSIILVLVMVLALFAACTTGGDGSGDSSKAESQSSSKADSSKSSSSSGGEEKSLFTESGFPIANEIVEFHGAMPDNNRVVWNDNLQRQWMRELTNIDLTIDVYASDTWQEKLGVLLAGGDYPEFFYMADMGTNMQELYGEKSDILIDLKPYIDSGVMPNVKAFVDADADIYRIACLNGKLYALPWLANGLNEPCFGVNGKWMERLGLEQPTTLDELTDLFRAFRDEDADGDGDPGNEIPLSSGYAFDWLPMNVNFGLPGTDLLEDENHQVYYAPTTQNYKDYVTWLKLLYDEGLLDERVPGSTVNDERIIADATQGRIGCLYTANYTTFGESGPEYIGLNVVPYGDAKTGVWPAGSVLVQGTFAITDKCEYPEALLRFIDYYYTDEGQVLYNYGKEGETFKLNDDGSWEYLLPAEYSSGEDFRNTFSIQGMHYYPGIYSPWGQEHDTAPEVQNILKARAALVPITVKTICDYTTTQEEKDERATIHTDIREYVRNCLAKFVVGEMSIEGDWDEFQSTIEAMGLQTWIKVVQQAVDRFYAS